MVLRISEARDLGEINRYAFYEKTKTMLAAPPDMLEVNTKYIPQYYIVNVVAVIFTTNYPADGLYLPQDDRRHYVCGTDVSKEDFEKEDPEFWPKFWAWYAAGGIDDVIAYLAAYDHRRGSIRRNRRRRRRRSGGWPTAAWRRKYPRCATRSTRSAVS